MHKLLERQLKKTFGDPGRAPPEIRALLQDVSDAYDAADQDRQLLERSLELTSQELLQRYRSLRESEERYRRMVETASEGILMTDAEERIGFANERFAQMLGCRLDELVGRPVFDLIPADERAAARERLARRPEGQRGHAEVRFRRLDGSDLSTLLSASPIVGPDGGYQGVLAMVTDITDRKRAEDEVRLAYERLQELDRFRTQFINNAAHELGTPLTPILLQLHLLRAALADGDPRIAKPFDILERNVARLKELVEDILDVSKIQGGRLGLRLEAVELGALLETTVGSFQASAEHAGLTLHSSHEPGVAARVDPQRFGQVLRNLLGNALKFTPRGGSVHVSARRVGPQAQIVVRDDGRGIDPNDLGRLFAPFSQVHDTMQVTAPGTGLGLFICRGLLNEMGGKIWAESAGRGKGTSFIVELPLAATASQKPEPNLVAAMSAAEGTSA